MNILLVNPWITDFAAYDLWIRPLGLLYVGSFLRERGHSIRLVDCMDRYQDGHGHDLRPEDGRFSTGKFRREIVTKPDNLSHVPRNFNRYGIPDELFDSLVLDGSRPDAVLVTCLMTYWYHGAFEAIARIRGLLPGVPIALGGIYATLCRGHAVANSGADLVATNNEPSAIIDSIEQMTGMRGDGSYPEHEFASWREPAWDCYGSLPAALVMTSRGCPMHCTVCASRRLFPGFERREPSVMACSMLVLAEKGVTDCAFADDALLIDAERYAVPLFEDIERAGAPLRMHTPNGLHVREITPHLARLMRRAGVATVRLSLETTSEERAGDFSGKVTRDEFRRAASALLDAGYSPRELGAYVLAGLPGQTVGEVEDTMSFARDCGVPVKPALFSPVPGTAEYTRAVRAGMVKRDSDPVLHNNTIRTVDWFPGGDTGYRAFRRKVTSANDSLMNA